MSSKGKTIADGKGKRKIDDDDNTGRRNKKHSGVLQFFEDSACEADDSDDSLHSLFSDDDCDFLEDLFDGEANDNAKSQRNVSFRVPKEEEMTEEEHEKMLEKMVQERYKPGLGDIFPATRTVQQMMDTMDRMMDDPLVYNNGNGGAWPSQQRGESGRYNRRTPWEIKEGEGDYKMRFDMPGMAKQDVKVWVEEKMLVVKAEKKIENGEGEGDKQEEEEVWPAKGFGKYSFRIALPENIQYEKIKAEVRDGVLYINVPKASVSSKVLDINVE